MNPLITVVGLGPGGPELVTTEARLLLENDATSRWLRTLRHPGAEIVEDVPSFDAVYERATSIEAVYSEIVEALVNAARENGEVVYAVPGSPLVGEKTVELLRAVPDINVRIVPAMSFLDLVWLRLGIDPLEAGVRIVDGHRFAVEAAGERGPMLVAQCDSSWVLSGIKLSYEEDPPGDVTVLQRLGLPDEQVLTLPWEDLDREISPDHLTSIWIPHASEPVAYELARVTEISRRLRKECPWDREQTHESLGRYLIEETYELVEAIDQYVEASSEAEATEVVANTNLIEELGDLLFQVFAHSAVAEEEGRFNIADVARGVSDKLIERHPHVYGDVVANTPDDVMATWERNKRAAKGRQSIMDGIPRDLPALLYASKVLTKAARAGMQLSEADFAGKGLGGALLLLVNNAVGEDDDPEAALRRVTHEFRRRFEKAEKAGSSASSEKQTDEESQERPGSLD